MLLRDLVSGPYAAWRSSLTLLIAPIYNADGNERMALDNRPYQLGPVGGMGTRRNAQGLDLNRDHMKLESPEARALVRAYTDYDPHVVIDLHTTNGTQHAYHLTYAAAAASQHLPCDRRTAARRVATGHDRCRQRDGRVGVLPLRKPAACGGCRAELAHVRPPPALQQQLRRPAQPHRAHQRSLRLRAVRGTGGGDAAPCRGVAGVRARARGPHRRADRGSGCDRGCRSDPGDPGRGATLAPSPVEILLGRTEVLPHPRDG